eukprot:gene27248-41017_t
MAGPNAPFPLSAAHDAGAGMVYATLSGRWEGDAYMSTHIIAVDARGGGQVWSRELA